MMKHDRIMYNTPQYCRINVQYAYKAVELCVICDVFSVSLVLIITNFKQNGHRKYWRYITIALLIHYFMNNWCLNCSSFNDSVHVAL